MPVDSERIAVRLQRQKQACVFALDRLGTATVQLDGIAVVRSVVVLTWDIKCDILIYVG